MQYSTPLHIRDLCMHGFSYWGGRFLEQIPLRNQRRPVVKFWESQQLHANFWVCRGGSGVWSMGPPTAVLFRVNCI